MAERVIQLAGVLLLVAYLVGVTVVFPKPDGRAVFGDATHHFVQLRSLVFDRDLHFQNEYVRMYGLRGGERDTEWIFTDLTSTGYVRNYMPVGPALLWAPLYMAAAGVLLILSWLGITPPPDGFEPVLQLMPGVTGVVGVTIGAVLSFRMVRRYAHERASAIGVLAVWLGSHALYYSVVSPSYSHAASMFASAIFFAHWTATRHRVSVARLAQWGALAGFAALMRWQDAVLIVVPLLEAARWRVWPSRRMAGLGITVLAALSAFLPQMVVWHVLYGQLFAIPQGPGFMQWASPELVAVLFSDDHGLFTWAPLLLVGAIGFVPFIKAHPNEGLPMTLVVLLTWYVNAAVADWWGGEAFGARRFLSLLPIFALGVAAWLSASSARTPVAQGAGNRLRVPSWKLAVVAGLILSNALLLLQYQLFMKGYRSLSPYPEGWPDMWLTRFAIPFRLLESWLW